MHRRALLLAGSLLFHAGCATSIASAPVTAEALSCDELTELANALDTYADEYDASGAIPEDSQMDVALGDVVDALEVIARRERDAQLSANVRSMAAGYDDFDGSRFISSLDAVTARLDVLYARDC